MSIFPRISEVSRDDNSLGTASRGGDKAKGRVDSMPMEAANSTEMMPHLLECPDEVSMQSLFL